MSEHKKHMTVDDVRAWVARIAEFADPKNEFFSGQAHAMEDDMFTNVMKAIASGAPNARELAAAAMESKSLNIDRS